MSSAARSHRGNPELRRPDLGLRSCGDLISGSIDAAAEADFYTLTGQADDVITLALVETSNWGLSSNDARLTLFAPEGAKVISFDSNGQQQITLPESGTYVVRITAENFVTTGTYDLGLECNLPP